MRTKRLQTVQNRISRLPYRYEAIDNAYATFLEDGTLPADSSLAWRVLQRVLKARKAQPDLEQERLEHAADRTLVQPYGTTREMLFREACCDVKSVRDLARLILEALVDAGHDPTDAEIIGPEMEPMDFATVSMRLLGWPEHFVRPEYQAQQRRVLRQQAEVRAERPRNNAEWDRDAGAALASFLNHGRAPSDSRYFLYVLTTGEQLALVAHYFGRGGEDLLAAYEAVATSSGDKRVAALRRLGELQARPREDE